MLDLNKNSATIPSGTTPAPLSPEGGGGSIYKIEFEAAAEEFLLDVSNVNVASIQTNAADNFETQISNSEFYELDPVTGKRARQSVGSSQKTEYVYPSTGAVYDSLGDNASILTKVDLSAVNILRVIGKAASIVTVSLSANSEAMSSGGQSTGTVAVTLPATTPRDDSLGSEVLTITDSAIASLTIPATADYAEMHVETTNTDANNNGIRYVRSGANPNNGTFEGQRVSNGGTVELVSASELSGFKVTGLPGTTGTVFVEYSKQAS